MAVANVQLVSLGRRERDSNINIGSFSATKKHSDKSRWICIYPAYLNSKKTLAEGRKLPVKQSVENPTLAEIRDVLVAGGFQIELEANKVFPRELNKYEMIARGRVRVHLKNDDNTPVKANFPTRDSVLAYLGETIPKLKSRGTSTAKGASASTASSSSSSASVQSKNAKKKK